MCDNAAVVSVLNNNNTRDVILATMLRNIWLQTSIYDFQLEVVHIQGCKNTTADLLSRWHKLCNAEQKLKCLVDSPVWWQVAKEMLILDYNI